MVLELAWAIPTGTHVNPVSVNPVEHCAQRDGESCEMQPVIGVKQKPELRILGGAQDVQRPSSCVDSWQSALDC